MVIDGPMDTRLCLGASPYRLFKNQHFEPSVTTCPTHSYSKAGVRTTSCSQEVKEAT
jgi:hypothetical protein